MNIQEFTARTNYQPDYEEYKYIEESYYEFDGDKDAFCQQWKKDKKSGKWDLELRLRKAIDQQKAEYEAKLAEKEEAIEFYRPYYDRAREAEAKLKKLSNAVQFAAKIINVER